MFRAKKGIERTPNPDEEYLPLARQIGELARQTVGGTGDVAATMSQHIDSLVERERARLAKEAYDALDPSQKMDVLERYFSDDTLRTVLAAERQRIVEQESFTTEVERLQSTAERTRAVKLGSVPVESIVEIELYLRDDYDEQENLAALRDTAYADRIIRGSHIGDGQLHILEDYMHDDYDRPKPRLDVHSVAVLGSRRVQDGAETFIDTIYAASSLEYSRGNKVSSLQVRADGEDFALVVGGLTINDVQMFEY